MVPAERASQPLTLLICVRYHGTKAAKVSVGLDAPKGWQFQPIAPLDFSGAGDQLIRFNVTPPAHVAAGANPLHSFAQLYGEKFTTSLEPIPLLPTRDWSQPANVTVHVLNLMVPAHFRVGYIAASNDPIPDTLRQIGIQVDLLDEVALAFEDLSRYDAIVVGIRAYDLRPDLMRSNRRLLNYVQQGGSSSCNINAILSGFPRCLTPRRCPARPHESPTRIRPCTSSRPIIRCSIHLTKSRSPISKAGTRSAAYISWAYSIRTIAGARPHRSRRTGDKRLACVRPLRQRRLYLYGPFIFPRAAGGRSGRVSPVRQLAEPDSARPSAQLKAVCFGLTKAKKKRIKRRRNCSNYVAAKS